MITFELLDKNDIEMFNLFAKWENDPEIKEYITPRRTQEEIPDFKGHEMMEQAKENTSKAIYVAYINETPIGAYTIDKDFQGLYTDKKNTAWISILIGERDYWGKGLSKLMMMDLEEKCRTEGFEYIELGVFAFNIKALKLYKAMGYKEIGVIEDFVYHKGEWKNDIRMLKKLSE